MVDQTNGDPREGSDGAEPGPGSQDRDAVVERLDKAECLRLIEKGGIGRLAYSGRFGPTVIPVNYALYEGAIVFRTALGSPVDEDLRTGIAHAEYQVAFEIDALDMETREGWSVLIQGPAHHVDTEDERVSVLDLGLRPWAGGERDQFVRIRPTRVTGRRIRRTGGPAAG